MKNKYIPLLALLIPVLALAGLAIIKREATLKGELFTIQITPFDPRSLLSGNYLIYRLDYKADGICSGIITKETYICLKPSPFFTTKRPKKSKCSLYIKGRCRYRRGGGRFTAGIERFYIPRKHSAKLEKALRKNKTELVLKFSSSGTPTIIDLLINGISWKNLLMNEIS